jgi:hypothetical protein
MDDDHPSRHSAMPNRNSLIAVLNTANSILIGVAG